MRRSGAYATLSDLNGNGAIFLVLDRDGLDAIFEILGEEPDEWIYSETIRAGINQIIYYGTMAEGVANLASQLCSFSVGLIEMGISVEEQLAICRRLANPGLGPS